MSKIITLFLLSAALLCAEDKSIYRLAHDYNVAYNKDFDYINNLDTAFSYFEFKGYIKSILDSSNAYNKCKKILNIKDIANRAAIIIDSADDRHKNEYISAMVAVNIACDVK